MRASNLLKLLSKLDSTEWKRFEKFVHSPYFNSKKSVIELVGLLKKYHPTFESPRLAKKKVFQKLFPNQVYNQKRMWQLMSDLKGLAEQFLVIEKNQKQHKIYQLQLKEVFFERGLYDWFEQRSALLKKELADTMDLVNEFHLHRINDDLYFNNYNQTNINNSPNLLAANDHLQYYFHLQQLRYACEWLCRSKRLEETVPHYVQSITYRVQYRQYPLYQLYYDIFILYHEKKENLPFFKEITAKLKQNRHYISRKHQIALTLYLINYSVKQLQSNNEQYQFPHFELYQLGLADHCFIYKGVLSVATFINIVSSAGILKKFEWADAFIQDFAPFLPANERANCIAYAKASLALRKENYALSISILNGLTLNSSLCEIAKRSLETRACLGCMVQGDLSYYELLINKSFSFEKYLHRKTDVSTAKKRIYFNTCKVARRLGKLIYQKATFARFQQLINEIIEMEAIGAKDWFLHQIQLIQFERTSEKRTAYWAKHP